MRKINKYILATSLFCSASIISFSTYADIGNTNDTEEYQNLVNKINQENSPESKKYFDGSFPPIQARKIVEKAKTIVKSNVPEGSPKQIRKEILTWDLQNIIDKIYNREGFLYAGIKSGLSLQDSAKLYDKAYSQFLYQIKSKMPLNEYGQLQRYNELGMKNSIGNVLVKIQSCEGDRDCIQNVAEQLKNEKTTDIFEQINSQCALSKDIPTCRVNVINSKEFQPKINYNNFLLGIYSFKAYKDENK